MCSKHFKRIATALLCVMIPAVPAFAIDHLGTNTFYAPPLHGVNDLHTMVQKEKYQIKIGLRAAGLRSIYEDFMTQIKTTDIREVQYQKGTHLQWMFFRKNGTGPLRLDYDVVWESDTPFKGLEFTIESNGKHYIFVVPEKCGNLALRDVTDIPAAPAPAPVVEAPPQPEPAAPPVVPVEPPKEKRYSFVADVGAMHQFDPVSYAFARFGVEGKLIDNYTVRVMAGFAGKIDGDQGDNAALLDATFNRYWDKWYAGVGIGGWFSFGDNSDEAEDTDFDLIVNAGRQIYEKPGQYSLDFFVEARADVDELDDYDKYSIFGAGIRCHF